MTVDVRLAAANDDLVSIQCVERAAGAPFAAIGMTVVADDEPLPVSSLAKFVADRRCWLAVEAATGRYAGYLLASWVDGVAHLEQVSVDPAFARRRIGVALLDQMISWAQRQGSSAITLTTYAEVPWNAPYYARLGFRVLGTDEEPKGLRAIREEEALRGLDRWPRCSMRRELLC